MNAKQWLNGSVFFDSDWPRCTTLMDLNHSLMILSALNAAILQLIDAPCARMNGTVLDHVKSKHGHLIKKFASFLDNKLIALICRF